ncbi:MAG: hypothetical protein ABIY55_34240 [Kofleriaceae bacterium]
MSELAQKTEDRSNPEPAIANTLLPGRLKLSGNQPITIYVAPFVVGGVNVGGFGIAAAGDFYQDGIKWKCGLEYSMFVTLTLLPGIAGVDCDELPYSVITDASQLLAIGRAAHKTKYHCYIKFPDGSRHDPKIIVTPITQTDDDE